MDGSVENEINNIFRFKSDKQRLASLDVDVTHKLDYDRDAVPQLESSFFLESLVKWKDQNCTNDFTNFLKEFDPHKNAQSFAQLLHQKEWILGVLKSHLEVEGSQALQPLLELLIAIVRDLHSEFYPHFGDFLSILCSLAVSKNPDIAEWSFTAISYLMKHLRGYVLSNFEDVFGIMSSLLSGERPEHVHNAAATSLAPVLRKHNQKPEMLAYLLLRVVEKPQLSRGMGRLIYEVVKGVNYRLHSRAFHTLRPLFTLLNSDEIDADVTVEVCSHTVKAIADYTVCEHSVCVWDALLDAIESYSDISSLREKTLKMLFRLTLQLIEYEGGALVHSPLVLLACFEKFVATTCEKLGPDTQRLVLRNISQMLLSRRVRLGPEMVSHVISQVLEGRCSFPEVLFFASSLFGYSGFDGYVLAPVLASCDSQIEQDVMKRDVLRFLAELILCKRKPLSHAKELDWWRGYPLEWNRGRDEKTSHISSYLTSILEKNTEISISSANTSEIEEFLQSLIVVSHVQALDADKVVSHLDSFICRALNIVLNKPYDKPLSKRPASNRNAVMESTLNIPQDFISKVIQPLEKSYKRRDIEAENKYLDPVKVDPIAMKALRKPSLQNEKNEHKCSEHACKVSERVAAVKNLRRSTRLQGLDKNVAPVRSTPRQANQQKRSLVEESDVEKLDVATSQKKMKAETETILTDEVEILSKEGLTPERKLNSQDSSTSTKTPKEGKSSTQMKIEDGTPPQKRLKGEDNLSEGVETRGSQKSENLQTEDCPDIPLVMNLRSRHVIRETTPTPSKVSTPRKTRKRSTSSSKHDGSKDTLQESPQIKEEQDRKANSANDSLKMDDTVKRKEGERFQRECTPRRLLLSYLSPILASRSSSESSELGGVKKYTLQRIAEDKVTAFSQKLEAIEGQLPLRMRTRSLSSQQQRNKKEHEAIKEELNDGIEDSGGETESIDAEEKDNRSAIERQLPNRRRTRSLSLQEKMDKGSHETAEKLQQDAQEKQSDVSGGEDSMDEVSVNGDSQNAIEMVLELSPEPAEDSKNESSLQIDVQEKASDDDIISSTTQEVEVDSNMLYGSEISDSHKEMLMILINFAMESFLHIISDKSRFPTKSNPEDKLSANASTYVDLCQQYPRNIHAIRTADLYFKLYSMKIESGKDVLMNEHLYLETLFQTLKNNLTSPCPQMRLVVTNLLLEVSLSSFLTRRGENLRSMFSTLYKLEEIPVTMHESKERLRLMNRLHYDVLLTEQLTGHVYIEAPLRSLLSVPWINFLPFWKPSQHLIASFANGMDESALWSILKDALEIASATKETVCCSSSFTGFLLKVDSLLRGEVNRLDVWNYRQLWWQAMEDTRLSSLCEKNYKHIVHLVLDFVRNEMSNHDHLSSPTQNLCDSSKETDDVLEELEEIKKHAPYTKLLRCMLSVLRRFKNPRGMDRQEELRELYYDLLSHRNPDVQKLAFECVMTYRPPSLIPYREHFSKVLDDRTFKTELLQFSVDEESSEVLTADRPDVMDVITRIMYGKMGSQTGEGTKGKKFAHYRRSVVLRFFSGSKEIYLHNFFSLAFGIFKEHIKDGVISEQWVEQLISSVDVSKVVPFRRMRSSLNLLGAVFSHLGSMTGSLVDTFLQVILLISAMVTGIYKKEDLIAKHHLRVAKDVKASCLERLKEFINVYEEYPWDEDRVGAVFQAAIWPSLYKLPMEAIHSPTPLLKLLNSWTENLRYISLFSVRLPDSPEHSVIYRVIQLLDGPKTSSSVRSYILDIVAKMMGVDQAEERPDVVYEEVDFVKISNAVALTDEDFNLGTKILYPYLNVVLSKLQAAVSTKSITSRDLTILKRISEIVREPEHCRALVTTSIPVLRTIHPTMQAQLLSASSNAIRNVHAPHQFLWPLAPLFNVLKQQGSRSELCKVLQSIAEQDEGVTKTAELARDLNAWDEDQLGQLDYETRLSAFSRMNAAVKEEPQSLGVEHVAVFINNAAFFVRTCEDMSLRDSASHSLRLVCQSLGDISQKEKLLNNVLIPLLKQGICLKEEIPRHEFISILRATVISCSDCSPKLKDLRQLVNLEEIETDFYESICHMQIHRRARALHRLHNKLCEESFHIETLSSYILPLVSVFLFNDSYSKHNILIDAVIEVIGKISSLLPWNDYFRLLQHYLKMLPKLMDYQKCIVKLIVTLLDNFNFDLSKSKGVHFLGRTPSTAPKKVEKEEEEENRKPSDLRESSQTKDLMHEPLEFQGSGDCEGTEETGIGIPQLIASKEAKEVEVSKEISSERATKIHSTIMRVLLPALRNILSRRSKADKEHRLNKKVTPEDEEILRVPIALAMVKLLQKLPKNSLEHHLSSIFLKVAVFLKSRAESIREVARSTLIKMMQALGPKSLPSLLNTMEGVLQRGYQVHIFLFTAHAVLKGLVNDLQSGDLDSSLSILIKVCQQEFHGEVAEEKEAVAFVKKLKEAQQTTSYTIFHLMAQFVSRNCLVDLVQPLKNILLTTHSTKMRGKVTDCLHEVVLGLCDNTGISPSNLLSFVYVILSESLSGTSEGMPNKKVVGDSNYPNREDSRLLPAEPGRAAPPSRHQPKTNMHILTHFALEMLYYVIKRNKVDMKNPEMLGRVDPFLKHLVESMSSPHAEVSKISMRCVYTLLPYPLPSWKTQLDTVVKHCFIYLSRHSGPGCAQGEIVELLSISFKLITSVIKEASWYEISDEQLRVLLTFCDEGLQNNSGQTTAFTLLKAIVHRKLYVKSMLNVMRRVGKIAIQDSNAHTRNIARKLMNEFLLDYPLGSHLKVYLKFFTNHLSYEITEGRESAHMMLRTVVDTFPMKVLLGYLIQFYVEVCCCLVNDDEMKCRKLAAATIQAMLNRVDIKNKDMLFDLTVNWFSHRQVIYRRIAVQVVGFFVDVEGEKGFSRRLPTLLPIFKRLLVSHRATANDATLIAADNGVESENEDPAASDPVGCAFADKERDHLLYLLLNSFYKMCKVMPTLCRGDEGRKNIAIPIWMLIVENMEHPHVWVRLICSQLVGLLMSCHTAESQIGAICSSDNKNHSYLLQRPLSRLKRLTQKTLSQFLTESPSEQLLVQMMKNLTWIAKVVLMLERSEDNYKCQEQQLNMKWLIRRLRREMKLELTNTPHTTIKRVHIMTWIAMVMKEYEKKELQQSSLLPLLLSNAVRDLNTDNTPAELKEMAQGVASIAREMLGVETFSLVWAKLLKELQTKRLTKKTQKAHQAIVNPERAAARKIKQQLAKKASKKKKRAHFKSKAFVKRLKS